MGKYTNCTEQLFIPRAMLDAAGLPLDYDVVVCCYDGVIVITEAPQSREIPEDICVKDEEFGVARLITKTAFITGECAEKGAKKNAKSHYE